MCDTAWSLIVCAMCFFKCTTCIHACTCVAFLALLVVPNDRLLFYCLLIRVLFCLMMQVVVVFYTCNTCLYLMFVLLPHLQCKTIVDVYFDTIWKMLQTEVVSSSPEVCTCTFCVIYCVAGIFIGTRNTCLVALPVLCSYSGTSNS